MKPIICGGLKLKERDKMREIKYRGQKLESSEWVFGGAYGTSKRAWIVEVIETEYGREIIKTEVKPETIGEFIGLSDRFDEDIYEGDILEKEGGFVGYVKYCAPSFERVPTDKWSIDRGAVATVINCGTFAVSKVVGNIHDTPELMG